MRGRGPRGPAFGAQDPAGGGTRVTLVSGRDYSRAIYGRTPGGVPFEIATYEPGFERDEDPAHPGEALKPPGQHAHLRPRLEQTLTSIID